MAKRTREPDRTQLPLRLVADLALPDGVTLASGSMVCVITTWTAGGGTLGLLPTRIVRYWPEGAYPWEGREAEVPVEALEAATGKERMQLV